jgi:hypothetical protein
VTLERAALIGFQVVIAILVGLGIRELWLARSGDDGPAARAPETLAVQTRVTPDVHTFGEPVVATVDVVADPAFIKPDTIRIEADFAPYEPDGAPTVERSVVDGVARVVFRYPLRCLKEGCDAASARGVAQLDPAIVHYRFIEGAGPGRQLVDWPPFEVASRVSRNDLEGLRWRASDSALPAVTTRVSPVGLALALVGLAILHVGAAVWLARRLWHTPAAATVEETRVERSRLERALDLVAADSGNGASAPDRRQTLERLARELVDVGQDGLAEDVRTLAWSPAVASGADVERLVRRVTETTGAGSA